MAKTMTATNTGTITSIEAREEIAEKRVRQAAIRKQLEEIDNRLRDINNRQRTAREDWLEARARAIADGKPEPQRPMAFDSQATALAEERHVLNTAHGMLQRECFEAAEVASKEVRKATQARRVELYRREIQATRDLLEAAKALEGYRAEMDAAGVYIELHPLCNMEGLKEQLTWFTQRITDVEQVRI